MRSHTGIILALLIATVLSQDFTASFRIVKKPGLSGTLTGTVYYSYASQKIRWQYTSGYQETTSYNKADAATYFSFRLCGNKCDTIPNVDKLYQPRLFKSGNTGDTAGATATILGQTCTRNTRTLVADEKITNICVNANNQAVEVVYQDGTTIQFSKIDDKVSPNELNAFQNWGCVFSCDSNLDIVLVLDESGSIDGDYNPNRNPKYTGEWASVATFAQKFTAQFEIGPNKVNIGLVKYGNTWTKVTSQLTSDSSAFTSLVNGLSRCTTQYCDSSTRIGHGVIMGVDLLKDQSGIRQTRKNLPKILVLVTDGADNNPLDGSGLIKIQTNNFGITSLANNPNANNGWGHWARNIMGIKIISVGVGSSTVPEYLKAIAGDPTLYIPAATFNYFATAEFINKLGTTVCTSQGTQSGCNVCGGLCACGVCQCPDLCDDDNKCTTDSCSPSLNGGGCLFKDISNLCNDGKRCTHDTCNPATGCVATPYDIAKDCDDNNKCTIESCDNTTGCRSTPVNCTNPNPCLVGSKCNPSTGLCSADTDNLCISKNPCNEPEGGVCDNPATCVFVPIDCTGGNKCISSLCDKNYVGSKPNGCLLTNVSCDDGNSCTEDTCDPVKGCIHTPVVCNDNDLCTDDICDDKIGCVFERFNVSERCNKGNLCTNYTCEASRGCVEAPLKCANNFNDSCLWVVCDPLQGCAPTPKKCNYTGKEGANCYINYCDSSKDDSSNCYYEQTDECRLTIVASTTAAVLGIGAIVGIIIAAVVCVGGGTTLAVLGYNGAFSGEFENKNPLYEKETKEGQNPLYKRNSKLPKPN